MSSLNDSEFAKHYETATEWMMDALAQPSASMWLQARLGAIKAADAAFLSAEKELARRLLGDVIFAAQSQGYTGLDK